MNNVKQRCDALIGERIDIRGTDYGVVVEVYQYDVQFILVTDIGKQIEALSYFRYLRSKHVTHKYPDGTDMAARMRLPKAKGGNIKYVPTANLRNIAHVDYRGENKRGGN